MDGRLFLEQSLTTLLLVFFSVFIFVLTFNSPVSQASADPHFSLIVSQAILENQTIKLDAYEKRASAQFERYAAYGTAQIAKLGDHFYYRYPLGTSVFSLPFVWGARQFWGKDVLLVSDNHQTQNGISALICAAVFLFVCAISRCYLEPTASFVIAVISTLGSALTSTLATALWSIDFMILFELLALWLIARHDSGKASSL